MKKRTRFVIVLAVLGLCFVFLYPTLKWYFWTDKDDKALALGSREKIKDYDFYSIPSLYDIRNLIIETD